MKAALSAAKSPRRATRQIVELRNQFDTIPHYDHTRAVEPLEHAATMGNG
jgi:erythromycin esterase-like protein